MNNHFYSRLLGCFIAVLIFGGGNLMAQPVLNARNIALGGGGTAYLNGIEANFYNPANLSVYDREGSIHFSLGTLGTFFEPVLSSGNPKSQFQRYTDTFLPYEPGEQGITTTQRTTILDENYSGNNLTSEHLSRADIIWGGLQWIGDKKSYSIALRTRLGSRIEVGKGWYSVEDYAQNGTSVRDMTLIKQTQALHEISFGFAQEFQFLNGLIPRINKLYLGIAPKFLLGGTYENSVYNGKYITDDQNNTTYQRDFTFYSTGIYSDMISSYLLSGSAENAIDRELNNRFLLKPTGYGAGVDFGLTYLIPLGSDVSILDSGESRKPIEKSLRIGLSITDIGVVHYSSQPLQLSLSQTNTQINAQDPVDNQFIGSAGQLPVFFDEATELPNPFFEANSQSDGNFTVSLPTSFNAGIVLDINRVKLMSDLTLGLSNTAFTNKKLVAHFGVESRPLPYLPLRFGTTLAAGKPLRFGAGTGFESRYWDFSISTQVLVKSSTLTSDVVGGAIAALRFHL
ncbi:hypothetical protein G3570_08770 [Balneolaceae bacterium YR4-1]|uniref:DUF5723 domain-containing protein n=1 Tax=Halalkalibaculum roseum TaxID=2709311 RepID=A0A6M1SZT4_9BACT|nr:DUF5723 family protein [Halalkalibaculum roseum]NGP76724.1 hypothetical protein [Halalkalibaculum roseum]